jgi:hypothetical protein
MRLGSWAESLAIEMTQLWSSHVLSNVGLSVASFAGSNLLWRRYPKLAKPRMRLDYAACIRKLVVWCQLRGVGRWSLKVRRAWVNLDSFEASSVRAMDSCTIGWS